jgi:hypothetical protein
VYIRIQNTQSQRLRILISTLAELGDASDAETQPINEDYDVDVDAPDAIPRTPLAPAWVKPPPGPLAVKVIKIVAMIHGNGLTVAEFLDAFSWGDTDCTLDATLSAARVALWKSHQLPGILRRWHKPPRSKNSKKGRAKAARSVMENFALECAQEIFERELESLANIFESPAGDDIKEESLTSISFPKMVKLVKTKSPNLWAMLFQLGRTKAQQQRNPNKNPANVSYPLLFCVLLAHFLRIDHPHCTRDTFLHANTSSWAPPEALRHLLQVPWPIGQGIRYPSCNRPHHE